ncbi:hypothetical protein D3C73_1499760 [compost metagenome]
MGSHIHLDRIADEIGIFLNDRLQAVLFQVLVILVVLGIFLDLQNNIGTHGLFLRHVNRVTVSAGGFPFVSFLAAQRTADYGHRIGYHERGIEAYPELADNIVAILSFILVLEG